MRVLLDECLPKRLKSRLGNHECRTVPEIGLADADFDVFLTIDAGIPLQQNLTANPIAVILLHAKSNRFPDLEPLPPQLRSALKSIKPGELVRLPA